MRTVATYGVFDLFHEGHANLLRRASELGDRLIVGVTTNHFDEIRGKLNTTDSYEVRRRAVLESGFADEVIPEVYPGQKEDDVRSRHIDVMVFGSDWTGHFDYLRDICEVVYLPRTKGISSSALRNARHPEVRLGIIGTGSIARRFVSEAAGIGGMRIVGAYNPRAGRAAEFVKELGIGSLPDDKDFLATDDLDELLSGVDAVYVASPHQYHHEQTLACLCAGRHVLCEKPLAFSRQDAEELFSLAKSRNLVLLEAIKTAYCPGFEELVEVVQSGAIGEVRDVSAAFTRLTLPGLRERDDARFGGSFLELGSYGLLAIVRLLGAERAMHMDALFHTLRDERGVDLFTKAFLTDDGASATATAGIGVKTEGQLLVSGTQGYILAPAPWWLTSRFEVHHEDPNDIQTFEVPYLGQGLRYEISNFVHLVRGDEDRMPKLKAEESIAIAGIIERYMGGRPR